MNTDVNMFWMFLTDLEFVDLCQFDPLKIPQDSRPSGPAPSLFSLLSVTRTFWKYVVEKHHDCMNESGVKTIFAPFEAALDSNHPLPR